MILGYQYASVLLQDGRRTEYREQCARLLKRFRGATDPATAGQLTLALTIGTGAVDDWKPILEMARRAAQSRPDARYLRRALAGACLRANQLEDALAALAEPEPPDYNRNTRMLNDQMRALILLRLGKEPEAEAARARYRKLAAELLTPRPSEPLGELTNAAWWEWLEYEHRRHELAELGVCD